MTAKEFNDIIMNDCNFFRKESDLQNFKINKINQFIYLKTAKFHRYLLVIYFNTATNG